MIITAKYIKTATVNSMIWSNFGSVRYGVNVDILNSPATLLKLKYTVLKIYPYTWQPDSFTGLTSFYKFVSGES